MNWNIKILATPQQIDGDAFELLPLFSSELKTSVEKYREASVNHRLRDALHHCRRIRGAAATFGFKTFAADLLKAEDLIASGDISALSIADDLTAISDQISLLAASKNPMA